MNLVTPLASSTSVPVTEQPKYRIQIGYDTNGRRTGSIQSGSISLLPANVQQAILRETPSPAHSDPTPEGWLRLAQEFPDHIILSSDIHRREPNKSIDTAAPAIITVTTQV